MRHALGLVIAGAACTKVPPPSPSPEPVHQRADIVPPRAPALAPSAASGAYGTAHPTFIRAFDRTASRWMALCQARRDTDGDGKIEVNVGHHGAVFGDAMELYLVIGGGDGTRADNLVDMSRGDRWVALVRGRSLEIVDTSTLGTFELAGADVEDDHRPGAAHRAARFAGDRVLFIRHRDKADALVIHDLATHTEREVALPDRVWRFGLAEDVAEVYTIPRGTDFPVLETTLDAGECTGAAASWSSYGQRGPAPTRRYVDLATGAEVQNPTNLPTERIPSTPPRRPDVDNGETGPAHWK